MRFVMRLENGPFLELHRPGNSPWPHRPPASRLERNPCCLPRHSVVSRASSRHRGRSVGGHASWRWIQTVILANGCQFEVSDAVFRPCRQRRVRLARCHPIRQTRWPSVQACGQQSTAITLLLPIGFRSHSARLLPCRFEFLGYVFSGLEIHFIRSLPTKRGVRQS